MEKRLIESHSDDTEQKYKCKTFVFAPILNELNSKIENISYIHKRTISLKKCSEMCLKLCE